MYYVANSCGTSCYDGAFKAFRHYQKEMWCAIHYINQQNVLYKTHLSSSTKSQFMLSASFCMFQHQRAILREFSNNKGSQVQYVL